MLCGIDLGSRSVKIVLADEHGIQARKVFETVQFYREYGTRKEEGLVVDFAALGFDRVDVVVATGYGRNTIQIAGATVIPELKAHALGAIYQTGLTDFTLLDLGGQDSKVIKVKKGKMIDFETNDKCAASTGRYLENMAAVLGIDVAELSRHYEEPVQLSATCAIFGESELIGRIVEGHSTAQLAAGVNYSIIRRIKPMLKALTGEKLVFTGGVAQGSGIRTMLEQELAIPVIVPEFPQLNGAIGCIRYAQEKGR